MARPKLQSVKVLRNAGAVVVYATPARTTERWVPPGGFLTVPEAGELLGVSRHQLYRMIRRGRVPLEHGPRGAARRVPLVACRLLLAMSKDKRRTVKGGNVLDSYDPKRRRAVPAARS